MRVLLLKDVDRLGQSGDIKEVAGGFAKNFLIPRKLAVTATPGAMKQAKSLKDAAERRHDQASPTEKKKARINNHQQIKIGKNTCKRTGN